MPIPASAQLPAPKDWDEFENLCADLFALEWEDSSLTRYGRRGQRQHGVDIFGGGAKAVQCKGKTRWPPKPLTEGEMRAEVEKAKTFFLPLTDFIFATTADDDGSLQEVARRITDEHSREGLFDVRVLGWGEVSRRLTSHDSLVDKYYGFVGLSTLKSQLNALTTLATDLPQRTVAVLNERQAEAARTHRQQPHPKVDDNNLLLRRLRAASQRAAHRTNVIQPGGAAAAVSLSSNLYVRRAAEREILRALSREDVQTNLLVVQGEPGTGKSSVLWALRQRLESELGAEAWLLDAADLRAVFGDAPARSAEEIATLFAALRSVGRPPVVLIDTVDLALTTQDQEAYLMALLSELPNAGAQVLVTSRPGEARILAALEPRFVTLLEYALSEFRTAVTLHSRAFVRVRQTEDADHQASRLLEATARGLPIGEICRNPLTLRMLYTIYTPHEINVEEVDIVSLYGEFWDRRVAADVRTDAARAGPAGADLSEAAMRIAISMLVEGTPELPVTLLRRELVRVKVAPTDFDLLVSRGVLRTAGERQDHRATFFHQTFFEHASAVAIAREAGGIGLSALTERYRATEGNLFLASVLERALVVAESEPFATRNRADGLLAELCQHGSLASSVLVYTFVHRRSVPPAVADYVSHLVVAGDPFGIERLLGIAANASSARRPALVGALAELLKSGNTRWIVRSLDLLVRFHASAPSEVGEALRSAEIGLILRQGKIDSPQARYSYIDLLLAHLPFETDWALDELAAIFRKAVHQRSEDLALRVLAGLRERAAILPDAASALSERAKLLGDADVAVRLTSQSIAAALGELFVAEWRRSETTAAQVIAGDELSKARGLALDARAEALSVILAESTIPQIVSALTETVALANRAARVTLARACWGRVLPAIFDGRSSLEIGELVAAVRTLAGEWPANPMSPLGDVLFNAIRYGPIRRAALQDLFGDPITLEPEPWLATDRLGGRIVAGVQANIPGAQRALNMLHAQPAEHPLLASAVLGQFRLLPASDDATDFAVRLAARTEHLEGTIEFLMRASSAPASWSDLTPTFQRMIRVRYESGNPPTRREAVRLETELLRLGFDLNRNWEQLASQLAAEKDELTRSYLVEALAYLLPGEETARAIKLAWLLQFGRDQGVRVRRSILRMVGTAVSGRPGIMGTLLEACLDLALGDGTDGEMLAPLSTPIFDLYQQNDPRVPQVLFRIIERCSTLPMHACRNITGRFRRQFGLIAHRLSTSDAARLLDQVPSMNPYVARMVLQGLLSANVPEMGRRLAAIARDPASQPQTVDLASRLLKSELRSSQPTRWPELQEIMDQALSQRG